MRIQGGLIILAVVVGLCGCKTTGQNTTKGGDKGGDNAAAAKGPDPALPPDVGGVIYGRVKDNYNQPVTKAVIEVVDLQDPQPDSHTKFEVSTNSEGMFDIPGLKPGRRYKLVARVDGSTLYGVAEVTTPTTNVIIRLVDDPDAKVPAKVAGPDLLPDKAKNQNKVQLGAPSKDDSGDPDAKGNPNTNPPLSRPTNNGVDPSRVVDGSRGFDYVPPRTTPPSVSIPTPPPTPTVPDGGRDQTQRVPTLPTPVATQADGRGVPSCVLSGDRLTDFSLYDLDGKPYQYRANSQGRVLLLFFWTSNDGACREYLSALEQMHEVYSPFNLDVVGIAYEQGDSTQGVRSARGRYNLRYRQLLGGDGSGTCPVRSAFGVVDFPTLVVVNRDGIITYRTGRLPAGDSDESRKIKAARLHELEQKVRDALGVKDH